MLRATNSSLGNIAGLKLVPVLREPCSSAPTGCFSRADADEHCFFERGWRVQMDCSKPGGKSQHYIL